MSNVVQSEVNRLSDSIAVYARDRFYDDKVVPQLVQFRDNGGRIRDLEDAISQQSDGFKVELDNFLETVQEDFKQSLSQRVSEVIGKKLSPIEVNVEQGMDMHTSAYRKALDETVTAKMTGKISMAVTAAVAATVGTLSGGFGKVLGIAVISTLLHTTGPVGFIIGALAGLLLGGGASILAKDKITDVVKNQKFPAFSTRFMLRESKMNQTVEEGRVQVYSLIKTQIRDKLAPHINEITHQIISTIGPVVMNGKNIET
jgi:gas vesicle protein